LVHNGTGLTSTTSSYTPSNATAYDVVVTSDGAGNCALYVNGLLYPADVFISAKVPQFIYPGGYVICGEQW
jgi:RNA 3'-terminal phosphate cyclase